MGVKCGELRDGSMISIINHILILIGPPLDPTLGPQSVVSEEVKMAGVKVIVCFFKHASASFLEEFFHRQVFFCSVFFVVSSWFCFFFHFFIIIFFHFYTLSIFCAPKLYTTTTTYLHNEAHNTPPHHITSHHTTSHHIPPHRTPPHHTTPHHTTLH